MKALLRWAVMLPALHCCAAFRSPPLISHRRTLKRPLADSQSHRMYHGEALAEALHHVSYTLADASRGGPVVEQVPYVPGEVPDFDKILLGSAACVLAYTWAAVEFGRRIATQRACEVCNGSGLVTTTRSGKELSDPVKCYACGGFLPWQNWGRFWQANMDVGNGGVLRRPAEDFAELNEAARAAKAGKRASESRDD